MDVRCTRCGTEYEFDDALISERGTSVRCTQCGHQFKVFPPQLAGIGPDEWIVLTSLGRRVVYRSLRELQNGISKAEVAREDLLARGSKPPRPLGSIAELDSLFVTKAAPERQPSTLTGVAPPAAAQTKGAPAGAPARRAHDNFAGVASPPVVDASVAAEGAKAVPPPGGSLGKDGRDTFSGVAAPQTLGGSAATGNAKAIPPPGGSLGKEGHDTFSGVAPPPNPPEAAENPYANRAGAPLRVGGSRTVLGIGSAAPESTIAFEPRQPAAATEVATSSPPETQSFEPRPRAPMPSIDEEGTILQAPPLPPFAPAEDRAQVEAPVVEATQPLALNAREPRRAVASSVAEPASNTLVSEAELGQPPAAIGRVQLEKKLVRPMASDPPTEKWTALEVPAATHGTPASHGTTAESPTEAALPGLVDALEASVAASPSDDLQPDVAASHHPEVKADASISADPG
ncbi:MAG TPA: zinc-ribbon domain-containing protein, partial [Polyangiaceae bacterium]